MPSFIVRYGQMRLLGLFSTSGGQNYLRGTRVIARTDRGLEAGDVLCPSEGAALKQLNDPPRGQILREMTADDTHELQRILQKVPEESKVCQEYIAESKLPMQLVDVERIFGGERIIVYYLADNRVDFRELVKRLAGEFQTRIEMRQIGVRDEAKLLADYGDCGETVCCNTHLAQMPPVSMKMAKLQKATLDPTKISGRCGRLKCCLRYEYDTYEAIQKELPPINSMVQTPEGPAKVIGHEILAQQVLVGTEDRRRILVDAADVVPIPAQPKEKPDTKQQESAQSESQTESNTESKSRPRQSRKRRPRKGPS